MEMGMPCFLSYRVEISCHMNLDSKHEAIEIVGNKDGAEALMDPLSSERLKAG